MLFDYCDCASIRLHSFAIQVGLYSNAPSRGSNPKYLGSLCGGGCLQRKLGLAGFLLFFCVAGASVELKSPATGFQFRGEFFNALNHSNLGTPDRFVNTPQFGTITGHHARAREVQLNARLSF